MDLIDRQAAIDALADTECYEWDEEPGKFFEWDDIERMLRSLPFAQPEPHWIPIKFRELTEEEKEYHPDWCYMADCEMPDDNQEILVTTMHDYVEKDVCYIDDGFSLDSGYDWLTDIKAWMPLPEPWGDDAK